MTFGEVKHFAKSPGANRLFGFGISFGFFIYFFALDLFKLGLALLVFLHQAFGVNELFLPRVQRVTIIANDNLELGLS